MRERHFDTALERRRRDYETMGQRRTRDDGNSECLGIKKKQKK